MRFLLPVGGIVDHRFGILTTPGHKGVPVGIKAGMMWAADNQAFTKKFNLYRFLCWLWKMRPYRSTCLFVPVADKVGDAWRTLFLFALYWFPIRIVGGMPIALVAQDGIELIPLWEWLPFNTLFVGGLTEWKLSQGAITAITRAQRRGKRIHIGRVNWHKRYKYFRRLYGSEHFTCDGTRTRFDGKKKTVRAWALYQAQLGLFDNVSGGNSPR